MDRNESERDARQIAGESLAEALGSIAFVTLVRPTRLVRNPNKRQADFKVATGAACHGPGYCGGRAHEAEPHRIGGVRARQSRPVDPLIHCSRSRACLPGIHDSFSQKPIRN
jgi:hypothetical protein